MGNFNQRYVELVSDILTFVQLTLVAITEHQRQNEHLRLLQSHYNTLIADNEMLRRELQQVRMQNVQIRGDVNPASAHPPAPQSAAPPQPQPYTMDSYANGGRPELPPIRSISNGVPNGPESMTGVQYEDPRVAGYR